MGIGVIFPILHDFGKIHDSIHLLYKCVSSTDNTEKASLKILELKLSTALDLLTLISLINLLTQASGINPKSNVVVIFFKHSSGDQLDLILSASLDQPLCNIGS